MLRYIHKTGFLLSFIILSSQLLLAWMLGDIAEGTRAQAAGVSISTALFLLLGIYVGSQPPVLTPWLRIILISLGITVVGAIASVFSPSQTHGMWRAMILIDTSILPSFMLMWIGQYLGSNSIGFKLSHVISFSKNNNLVLLSTPVISASGYIVLLVLWWLSSELSRWIALDPDAISVLSTSGLMLSAIAVGFLVCWWCKRLALVELSLIALTFGYTIYLGVALGPKSLLGGWSLPIQQILLALSLVPSIAMFALLAVGGSLGYLYFGTGRFDPGLAFETKIAMRYLQVNLRGTKQGLLRAFLWICIAFLSAAAGLYAHIQYGGNAALIAVCIVWLESFVLSYAYKNRLKGIVLQVVVLLLCWRASQAETDFWLVLALLVSIGLVWIISQTHPVGTVLFIVANLLAASIGFAVAGALGAGLAANITMIVSVLVWVSVYTDTEAQAPMVGVVTIISVVGVAIGVMALIVVLSVMSGFEEDLKSKILGAHAHIVVEKLGNDFREYKVVEERIRQIKGVKTAAAFVSGDAMLSTDDNLKGALVKGIDPTSQEAVAELQEQLRAPGRVEFLANPDKIPGACRRRLIQPLPKTPTSTITIQQGGTIVIPSLDTPTESTFGVKCASRVLPGIIIGRELSRLLRVYVGDVVRLVSPFSEDMGPTGPTPKLRRFRVAAVFYSGMYEYDAAMTYISIEQAQRFFGIRNRATGVELKVDNLDDSTRVASEVDLLLGGRPYHIKDWRQMNKELFSALLLEKLAMAIALAMITMVASFLIIATLVMIVLQRGREIAILKSVGASSASIMKIFVIQGIVVGVGGALLGVLAGLSICLTLENVGFKLDERIFYIEKLPVIVDWGEVGLIATSAVIITYLAAIYPAMTAAMLQPVEGLRDE